MYMSAAQRDERAAHWGPAREHNTTKTGGKPSEGTQHNDWGPVREDPLDQARENNTTTTARSSDDLRERGVRRVDLEEVGRHVDAEVRHERGAARDRLGERSAARQRDSRVAQGGTPGVTRHPKTTSSASRARQSLVSALQYILHVDRDSPVCGTG